MIVKLPLNTNLDVQMSTPSQLNSTQKIIWVKPKVQSPKVKTKGLGLGLTLKSYGPPTIHAVVPLY